MNILGLIKTDTINTTEKNSLINTNGISKIEFLTDVFELLIDAVPEAIYNELPPRLQREVQVDHSRAPSLSTP